MSIIVVTSDDSERTRLCLQSLAEYTPEEHEILAVESLSEGMKDLASGRENLTLVRKESKRNPFGLKNRAAATAQGKYLMFITGDTVVTPGWLTNMLSCIEKTGAGIVGPMRGQSSVGGRPNRRNPCKWRPAVRVSSDPMLISRDLFGEVRGFDDALCPGRFQDDDICLKAALLGRKVYLAGDTLVHNGVPGDAGYSQYILDSTARRFCSKWGIDDPNFAYPRTEFAEIAEPQGKRVLDLRCCAGATLLEALWEGAAGVTGLEPDRGLKKIALTHLSGNDGALVLKEMKDIPADSDSTGRFDLALAPWCLEASPNPRRLLRQARALISDNSQLMAIVRNSWSANRILPLLFATEPCTYPRPAWGPSASPDRALGWFWDSGFRVLELRFLHPPIPGENPLIDRLLSIPREYADGIPWPSGELESQGEPEPSAGAGTRKEPDIRRYVRRPYRLGHYSEEFILLAEPMRHPRRPAEEPLLESSS